MESSTLDAAQVAPPPAPRRGVDRRMVGIVIVVDIVAVTLAYLVINFPLVGPVLTRGEVTEHWRAAVTAALVVATGSSVAVTLALRARRASPAPASAVPEEDPAGRPRIPRSLGFETVPARTVKIAGTISLATIPLSFALGVSFALGWFAFLAPWIPLVAIEAQAKRRRDALFTGFALVVIVQLLHMVEHSVQVGQLVSTGGSLAKSHGIFGQLDFELVHFVTDTFLWVSLGTLLVLLKARNVWLWVAFVAASFHQVEHFYLFYLYHADNPFYLSGGVAGIMGKNGLIGSPLDRPYLHYSYNFIVFVPMVIAVWDEARRVDRLPRGASPARPAERVLAG